METFPALDASVHRPAGPEAAAWLGLGALVAVGGCGDCRGPETGATGGADTQLPAAELLEGVDLAPDPAFPDSLFRATARVAEGAAVDRTSCRWQVDGEQLLEGECTLDGRDQDLSPGAELQVVLTAFDDEGVQDRATSEARPLEDWPLAAITEFASGQLAFVDSEDGSLVERVSLLREDVDAVSAATWECGMPMKVGYDPEGEQLLVSSSTYGTVWALDPETREVVDAHTISEWIYWFRFSDDGETLYVTDMDRKGLASLDRDWNLLDLVVTGSMPVGIALDDDGRAFVPHHDDPWISVVDAARMEHLQDLQVDAGNYWTAVQPDQSAVWAACEKSDTLRIWSLPELQELAVLETGALPVFVMFDPAGERAWLTEFTDGNLVTYDVQTHEVIHTVYTGYGAVAATLREDERFLYVSNLMDGTVSVVDVEQYEVVDTWEGFGGPRWLAWIR